MTATEVQLVADASVLVAELLRARGRRLIRNPVLRLAVTERVWDETQHELQRRADIIRQRGRFTPQTTTDLYDEGMALAALRIARVSNGMYAHREIAARARIPRDPSDWPTVALAMALDAAIWTNDCDFLGCGLPTWTTETLLIRLRELPPGDANS
jgi:predicted nucleic acid-binding protein